MDLFLVSLLIQSLLILPFTFPETQADQDPVSKYSEYLNIKDVKEDMKRRRKLTRAQPISLKPPPQDWPEPQLAPGDFIVTSQSEATSLSPLLAYQAKLEKEYERKMQEKKQYALNNDKSNSINAASTFTSSEEDLQKLLDPDELLKHNKQLRPFINQGKLMKSAEKQGKEAKPAGISSLTALKAKTAARKTRKKAKTVQFMITTTLKPRKGRRRKISQRKESENNVSSDELKRKKSDQSNFEQSKTKHSRKRGRGFAFAERIYEDHDKITTKSSTLKYKTPNIEELPQETSPTDNSQLSKEKVKGNIRTYATSSKKSEVQDYVKTTRILSEKTIMSKKETGVKYLSTTSQISIPLKSTEDDLSFRQTFDSISNRPFLGTTEIITSDTTANEIQNVLYATSTSKKLDLQDHMDTRETSSDKMVTSKTKISVKDSSTTCTDTTSDEYSSSFKKKQDSVSAVPKVTRQFGTTETVTPNTTVNEVRKKRKEIKQEMEKVLDVEDLEGSFSDTDSDWTTSEKGKVPLHHVTPRHALMGILKNKVVSVIDNILKEGPKIKGDQIVNYEDKYRSSTTIKPNYIES